MRKITISVKQINILSLYAIISWYIVPIVSTKLRTTGLIALVAIWLLTSNLSIFISSLRTMSSFFYWYIYILVLFFLGFYIDTGVTPIYFFTMTAVTIFPAILYNYYQYTFDENQIKKLKKTILVFYLISSINTLIVLHIFPLASKILAMSGEYVVADKIMYSNLGTGGYGYIYSLVLVIVISMFSNFETKFWQIIKIVSILLNFYLIILSQYTLALLITCAGAIVSLLIWKKINLQRFLFYSFALFFSFFSTLYASNIFIYLADFVKEQQGLATRLREIAFFLSTGVQNYNLSSRVERYGMSIDTFLNNPFFGAELMQSTPIYGGHSAFFDQLAAYGIIGFSGYIIFYITNYRSISQKCNKILPIIYLMFLTISILNNTFFIYQLGFALLFVAPFFLKDKNPLIKY